MISQWLSEISTKLFRWNFYKRGGINTFYCFVSSVLNGFNNSDRIIWVSDIERANKSFSNEWKPKQIVNQRNNCIYHIRFN